MDTPELSRPDLSAHREALRLPANLNIDAIGSLSTEIKQKLKQIRPETLGAATHIPGMTPAAVISLLRYVKREKEDTRRDAI